MAKVSMNYKKMGIPVPVIARGINPHEVMRQSMFTLDGPVMTDKVALAGNHRLVMLDPAGGLPAFIPLSGYKNTAEFITVLSNLDQGHKYGDENDPKPGDPQVADPDVQGSQKLALENLADTLSEKVWIQDGATVRQIMMTDPAEPLPDGQDHADWYYVLDLTPAGTQEAPFTFTLSGGDKDPATEEVAGTQESTLAALIAERTVLPMVKAVDGTVNPAVIDDVTSSNNDWYYVLDFTDKDGTAEHPVEYVPAPDTSAGKIQSRLEWLFNRIFVVRAGTEFAEMPILDPVLDHESLDAAHDSCIRLNKGRISNLCILDLADDADLETYVFNTKAGETASLFVKEVTDANTGATEVKAALAPASFGTTGANPGDYTGPFSGWVEVKLPSVVINDAYIKQTTDVNGVKHANVMIDITCC